MPGSKKTVSIRRGHFSCSSETGSDKVSLPHNKAHGGAEKAEKKISWRCRRHKRATERWRTEGFYFREKRHSSFSQANALIKRSDKFRCSTQRRCLRYRVFASFTPCLCGIFHLNYNVEYFIKAINARARPHHSNFLKTHFSSADWQLFPQNLCKFAMSIYYARYEADNHPLIAPSDIDGILHGQGESRRDGPQGRRHHPHAGNAGAAMLPPLHHRVSCPQDHHTR